MTKRRVGGALRQSPWVGFLLVVAASLLVYLPTVNEDSGSTDVVGNSLYAWRLAHTGQPWMDGLQLDEDLARVVVEGHAVDGHLMVTRTPGQVWAAVPFYLGTSDSVDDFSHGPGGWAAAVMTALAVGLMYLALRTRMQVASALGVSAVLAVTTPMWSVSADALWTHSLTGLALAGAAWAAAKERWWLVGTFLGVGILARPHIAMIAAVVGLGLAWSRRSPRIAVQVGLASAAGLGTLAAWTRYVQGRWDIRGPYSQDLTEIVPGVAQGGGYLVELAGFLISPDRGFLVWTPLALLLLPAVVRSWRHVPDWARWLAIGGIVYTLVQTGLSIFGGGDAFYAYRRALELLVCLVPLYAFSLPRAGAVARRLGPVVVAVQFAAISLGSIVEGLWLNKDDVWTDNSLFHALRHAPLLVVPYLVVTGLFAGLVAKRWVNRIVNDPSTGQAAVPRAGGHVLLGAPGGSAVPQAATSRGGKPPPADSTG